MRLGPMSNNDSQIWASTPNTPRVNTRGGLERNIHTRTLARMVGNDEAAPGTSSSPTQSYGRLQTTASPFRSSLTQKFRRGDSNAELIRDFTRMIRDTPRNLSYDLHNNDDVDFGDLERDPDVDLLLSKICLECVYVEPKQGAIPRANKVFLSNFLGTTYLNLVSTEGEVMKIIPIWKSSEMTRQKLSEGGKNEPVTVTCIDAAFVRKSGVTITLSYDYTTAMYGGNERIAPIFIPDISNKRESIDYRLHTFSENHIFAINGMNCCIFKIPETVLCRASTQLMTTCFLYFNREFSRTLLRRWRAIKREIDLDRLDFEKKELAEVAVFMLNNVGVNVTQATEPVRADSPEEHGGKRMKPEMSAEEVDALMKDFFDDMMFKQTTMSSVSREEGKRTQFLVELEPTGDGFEHARDLFNALHAQCEEWSIFIPMHPVLLDLIPYAYILSKALNYQEYEQYYIDLFQCLLNRIAFEFNLSPHLHEQLKQLLSLERTTAQNLGTLPKSVTKKSLHLLTVLVVGRGLIGANVNLDCQLWIGQDWARRLGLSGETLKTFRSIMNDSRSNSAGKADKLLQLFDMDANVIDYMVICPKILLLKYQADAFAGAQTIEPKKCIFATPEEMTVIAALRWSHDIRKRNVEQMLDSSRPILVATNILRRTEDDNMKELQDRYLTQTSFRSFAQSFGRAYYYFRSSVPSLLTNLHIPRLHLGGMVYPARVTCDPPTTDVFKSGTEWAHFYNALAAALKMGSSDTVRIDNEWVVMVSKSMKSHAVIGGMILGLGLNGHLANFNMYYAHSMLTALEKFQSVALLLGLCASNLTTCDLQIHKILATHLPFLMGPNSIDVKLEFVIQTAAVAALGLLFADSGNMNIAKKLVNEIGKAPSREEEPVTDRSAYKLAAGFSLGLIMLGKGNGAASSVIPFKQNIPPISKRLIFMMKGMRRDQCVFLPQATVPVTNETSSLPFTTGALMTGTQVAHHVKESNNINIHQSADAAAIALGFTFMKTHNQFIANALAIPETITDIERIIPLTIYTRVLGQCLVMWDKIEPSHEFIKGLVPRVIKEYALSTLHFGAPIKRDKDGQQIFEELDEEEEKYWNDIVDRGTVAQAYLYAVTAGCMAIALKFSSCGGPLEKNVVSRAFKVIEFYVKIVVPQGKSAKNMGSVRMCMQAGGYTRATCYSMLVIAMSILKVGTGDLTVMRYARLLRQCDKPDSDWHTIGKKHFEQMIAHQSLGMLLLGEGRYAFKKDPLSIALIIMATFPSIPCTVADNSHYHQPLRFMWSLAAEPRLLVPFDVAENNVTEVAVTIILKPTKADEEPVTYRDMAPLLLPPLEDLNPFRSEVAMMRDVMSVGQGRIMLKRYNVHTTDMKINEATALVNQPLQMMDLLMSENTAYHLDEEEIRNQMAQIEHDLNLNSSDQYPNAQVQMTNVRDIAQRIPDDLAQLHKKALFLLGDCLDLWPDEVNVSNTIRGLAEEFRSMQI
ncbi:unnamed protein product [Caenorhabditis sp. 36 PRJEB53466]|nr:unnamed protein product [Caenorhabditis sp. 36 PRJEB53466]